jgi:hypothetical protein
MITKSLRLAPTVFSCAFLAVACSKKDKTVASPAPTPTPTPTPTPAVTSVVDMSELASGLLPVVETTAFRFMDGPETCTNPVYTKTQENSLQGTAGFELLKLFGDPSLCAATSGGWGTENIRNNLSAAKMLADIMTGAGDAPATVSSSIETNPITFAVPARKAIGTTVASPFAFANADATTVYDYGVSVPPDQLPATINNVWKTGTTFSMLSSILFDESGFYGGSGIERDTFEGSYTTSTGAVRINKAGMSKDSNSESAPTFVTYMALTGNSKTSEFSLKFSKRNFNNTSNGGAQLSLVAKGISRGEGKFYALKLKSCSGDTCLTTATPVWYCIAATASPTDFATFINIADKANPVNVANKISSSASHTGFTGDCAAYATELDGSSYEFLGDADTPNDSTKYYSALGL